jgi:PadR family transcriptional regulator, regulatory protein AphA
MELRPLSYVVLGVLARRPGSGYDIKAAIDGGTRYFWSISYGQIYPELKRLAEAGLIVGEEAAQGGRPRTVHRLTDSGRRALADWLATPAGGFELRDEGLLKLFFADALGSGELVRARVAAKRAHHEQVLGELLDIEATKGGELPPAVGLTLAYGLGLHAWAVEWCRRTERRLSGEGPDAPDPDGGQ